MEELRRAMFHELDEIVDLCELVKKTYSFWDRDYPVYENFFDDYKKDLLFVFLVDNKIIGAIGAEKSEWTDEGITLHMFMVHPDYRQKGYGKKIFLGVEDILVSLGYKKIDLLVRKDHPFAMKMYENLGYTNWGRVKTPWEVGNDIFYLLYRKNH